MSVHYLLRWFIGLEFFLSNENTYYSWGTAYLASDYYHNYAAAKTKRF